MAAWNRLDLTGQRFGRLTVLKFYGSGSIGALWLCKCDCANTSVVLGKNLRKGITKSCGCWRIDAPKLRVLDRRGHRFGRLTVMAFIGPQGHHSVWRCICDCGRETKATGNNLQRGQVRSCGCLKSDLSKARARQLREKRWRNLGVSGHEIQKRLALSDVVRAHCKDDSAYLTDSYIKQGFFGAGLRAKDIPPEMIEAKRMYLKVYRLLKEKDNA